MIHAALTLIMLGGLAVSAVPADASQPSPQATTAYVATAPQPAVVTPVRWYGYRAYPGGYWYSYPRRYYGYRPYYDWYYPRRYYYGPDWDYGYYYRPYGFYYEGPRTAFRFGY